MIRFKNALAPAAVCLLLGATAVPAGADTITTRYTTTTTYDAPVVTTYDAPVVVEESILTMGQARGKALSAEPGRVENTVLVRNDFGEPIYVFDIRNGDMTHIVRVNAITGQVTGNRIIDRRTGFFDRLFAPMHSSGD